MGCICPSSKSFSKNGPPARDRVLQGLRVAKAVGATSMRCYMGASHDRLGPDPIELHMENTIKVFQSVRSEALDLGVKIALENHSGDLQAREVKTIIEEAGKDYVASCLDTGNPMWCIEDPFVTLETLAPYVVTTHVRDSAVFEIRAGPPGSGSRSGMAASTWSSSSPVPAAVPEVFDAARDYHRTSAYSAALPRSGLLESVLENAGVGVRALRGAGKERASVHGRDGDRGRPRTEAGGS